MLFAVVSDAVWLALIVAVSGLIKEFFDRKRAKEAAVKVAEVADNLDESNIKHTESDIKQTEKLNEIAAVGDKTHQLVNSQHGIALSTVYEQALRIAALTGLPEDRIKADVAKLHLDDHQRKQGIVDAKEAKE